MGQIKRLDDILANQIAAGEVVERPSSVVKELVENAVDAGATRITIDIAAGGSERIRIVDNGSGMSREDLELCVERHATSKLRAVSDLDHLSTLGFRGEALPSIASVSRFSIRTRRPGDLGALRLSLTGGDQKDILDASGPVGTEVVVEDLFFNVPARRKFLKKEATEASHIHEWVQRIALCYPKVAVKFIRDGKTLSDYPPADDLKNRIVTVFGRRMTDRLAEVHVPGAFGVQGYVGAPELAKGTTRHYHVFINGRYVRDRVVMSAIQGGYGARLTRGKHPFVVLLLNVPSQMVDVNVHPAKTEVRFSDSRTVHRMVARAIDSVLRQGGGSDTTEIDRPNAAADQPYPAATPSRGGVSDHRSRIVEAMERMAGRRRGLGRHERDRTRPSSPSAPAGPRSRMDVPPPISAVKKLETRPKTDMAETQLVLQSPTVTNPPAASQTTEPADIYATKITEPSSGAGSFFTVDGLAVIPRDGEFFLLDVKGTVQRLVAAQMSGDVQCRTLSKPCALTLDAQGVDQLQRVRAALHELGFSLDEFGGRTFVVSSAPLIIPEETIEKALMVLLTRGVDLPHERTALAELIATEVAENSALPSDLNALLDDWLDLSFPLNARPVFKFGGEDLLRVFP